jgi:LPXTG-motif cell wall-anchored protein
MARNNSFVPVETQGQDVERDDDLIGDDDGIFDSSDDLFAGNEEHDEEREGVFADRDSVFSTSRDPSMDHTNALTTREMTARRYEDAKPHESMKAARQVYNARAGFKKPEGKRLLVAKFDEQGRPHVAHHVDGKQVEAFRVPTEKEFQALKSKGKIVSGGVGEAPAPAGSIPWKKILIVGGVAAAGGAAWYFWKKRRNGAEVVDSVHESASFADDSDDESED